MAHFYATIEGARGPASRTGSKQSGINAIAASWAGSIETYLYHQDGVDMARVTMRPWHGRGEHRMIYHGPVSEYKPETID